MELIESKNRFGPELQNCSISSIQIRSRIRNITKKLILNPHKKVQRSPPPVRREVRQNMGYVVAKFDFQAQDDEDLPFKRGDILEIIRKQEDKENGCRF